MYLLLRLHEEASCKRIRLSIYMSPKIPQKDPVCGTHTYGGVKLNNNIICSRFDNVL